MQVAVGVDTGKSRHQAAAYDPAVERIIGQMAFSVDREGFDRFQTFLQRLAPMADQVVIGLEATGHYHRFSCTYVGQVG